MGGRSQKQISRNCGFTLIELIIVVVILGIISAVGSQFIVTSTNAFRVTELRSHLLQRARLSIEQITRELHIALPNAVRVSPSGNCIEFLPIVASTNYKVQVPDLNNGMSSISSISTGRFTLGKGAPKYAMVAPFSVAEVYSNSSVSVKASLGGLGTSPFDSIPLSASHQFIRNSVNRRVHLVDDPVRYCINNQNLVRYSGYGFLTSALDDSNPGGAADLVSHEVSATSNAFSVSPGSEDANVAVYINLIFSKSTESIDLNHQVLIRNVP